MIIRAKLSNPKRPDAEPLVLSFPITDYEDVYRALSAIGIGDAAEQDCRVEEISGDYPVLAVTRGQNVNVDELDYLAKRLESFFEPEAIQFECAASAKEVSKIEDFINLTFCCQKVTAISNFSDLKAIGRSHYLNKKGGAAPVSEMDALDGEKEAKDLIRSQNGKITPYGVVYENGMQIEPRYKGREFPAYLYEHCVMEVALTKTSVPDSGSTY